MVPLGLAFGRLGNFIGGELWGRLTDAPWAMIFAKSTGFGPDEKAALEEAWRSGMLDHLARHPSQLYQAGLEGLTLFFLLMWYSSKPRPRAAISGLFLAGYGTFRFIAEFGQSLTKLIFIGYSQCIFIVPPDKNNRITLQNVVLYGSA